MNPYATSKLYDKKIRENPVMDRWTDACTLVLVLVDLIILDLNT